jgi:hypothetical protein
MLLTSPPPGFAPDRCSFVALKGGDADNIADALTKVSGLDPVPSASNPAAIVVFPGVYSTPPFTLPAYVYLIGVGDTDAVILDASTATSALCTTPGPSGLRNLTLQGADGTGGVGVSVSGTGGVALANVKIFDCESGIECDGTNYQMDLKTVAIIQGTNGVYVNGSGALAVIDSVTLMDLVTGLDIGASGGDVRGTDLRVMDDSGFTLHVRVQASGSLLELMNSVYRMDKVSYHAGATIHVAVGSDVPGDPTYAIVGELSIGTEQFPQESAFGGGDCHVRGVSFLTNTNLEAGTWADITATLRFLDASSTNLFAGLTVGNCFYAGGDYEFPGLECIFTAARVGGAVVLEFWNGAAWIEIPHLSSDADAPYAQYAQRVFLRTGIEQIRFGERSSWATKSLNGITKYWVRFRVTTALTTSPAADQVKVHTDRTEINADGVLEYFGVAEPVRPLIWHRGLLEELEGFAQPDADIDIASGFSIKAIANRWQNGNKDGSATFLAALPGLDTSRPLIYEVGWAPEDTGAGNVELQLDVVTVNPGDILDGTLAYTRQLSQVVTGPFTAYALQVTQFAFTVPDLETIGSLAMALYRDAGGGNLDDTFNGDAMHVFSNLYGVFWR